ncbi:MAG: hypothetical protein CUN55_17715, partial [Phototrophicales bacterium]
MEKHTFISYKREDANFTIQLATDLKNTGFRVWVDKLDGAEIGENWEKVIGKALKSASALIAIITPEYFNSQYCIDEILYARREKIEILPIILRSPDWENIPEEFYWLKARQLGNLEDYEQNPQRYSKLLETIQDRLRKIDPAFEGPMPEAEAQYLNTLIGELSKRQGVEEYI